MTWRRMRPRRDRTLLVMTLSVLALLGVFSYVPMAGSVMAFQSYSVYTGFWHSGRVGLANFQQLLGDPLFWRAFENTLVISAVQLILYFPIPIALALLLNSILSSKVRSIVQSVVYLPHFFSRVLVITIFQQTHGGAATLNSFLHRHGFGVMTGPGAFKLLVTAQAVRKKAGWGSIV